MPKVKVNWYYRLAFVQEEATEQTSIFYFERQIKGDMVGIQKIVII